MSTIAELNPTPLWKHFAKLCEIPRPSKHEDKVVAYILDFAKARGLEVKLDQIGNIIIKKPATPGMEDRKVLAMQSHVDMVPQKNADTEHNFLTDSIKPYIDGEWVTAEGTTLGADNGIGVAAILALLESTDIPHPALEALLTIDEEAGMTGAKNLQPGHFEAELLLNLDTEDEGELYVGCAGGVDVNVSLPYTAEPLPAGYKAFKLSVRGLRGGHSGLDIDKGRGNANKVANRIIDAALTEIAGLRIGSLDGGSLRNAIPRESFSVVTVPADKAARLMEITLQETAVIKAELDTEAKLDITIEECETPDTVMDSASQRKLILALRSCPSGVERMSTALEGIAETSNNLARVVTESEDGQSRVRVQCLVRSLSDSARDQHGLNVAAAFELAGAETSLDNAYPGWTPNMQSPLLALMKAVYKEMEGKEPEVKVIHAGLECGLLAKPYPHWDMVSFGPTIRRAHSPEERVHIESVGNFWAYFLKVVEAIPQR
ncbi:aminoacyl-histidine dipeptidase [Microbulbifer hydrolyticus]|uniref:Cytosol non-specific dipeptidase n=1 Tax=Microbulbifer hydrolyticus TaxID=48074 RepID=A0A6P1TCC0_9GAMM|nr:aminoacyl-histidine dipeptidase [Microbulbifer hydrolyticus]MBB5210024.1 dipeptidase D [Microbulbifer hydrolyticus]QHQ39451.1 beta-Ala-His dipeptidase [Microbulbifer hydrolyticus]